MNLLFWSGIAILCYSWLGYLVLLYLLSKRKRQKTKLSAGYLPATVLLTVHNEAKLIQSRIENIFRSDYPCDLLEILVASDGSTDGTNEIVENLGQKDGRIKLYSLEGGGKSAAQNRSIPHAWGEIVVLTDAEAEFKADTIKNLIRNFSDTMIGCVSGKIVLMHEQNPISADQGLYWKFEMLLRRLESTLGCFHTASGAVMAFRKNLFRPFPCKFGDDCIIPLDIAAQGYKIIHEDEAIAYDRFPSSLQGELKARSRMTLRNITCTLSRYDLLNPFKFPLLAVAIISHKLLRWLTPYIMICVFISNVGLLHEGSLFTVLFYLQSAFYVSGVVGFIGEKNNHHIPVASPIFSFILANIGFFLGVFKALLLKNVTSYRKVPAI